MSALSIQPTYPIFTDIDGQPLEDGYIWLGVVNLAPITNPITVYWDAALTIPAAQPIRTRGGYPINSGTPARLYVNSDYSIQVQNRNGSVVYSAPAATERYGNIITAASIDFVQGGTGAVTRTVQSKLREVISVTDFGATGDGVTDDTTAIQNAVNYARTRQNAEVYFPPHQQSAFYKTTAPIVMDRAISIRGDSPSTTVLSIGLSGSQYIFDYNCAVIDVVEQAFIKGLTLRTDNGVASALRLKNISYVTIKDIRVYNVQHGIIMEGARCFSNAFEEVNAYQVSGSTVRFASNFTGGGHFTFLGCTFSGSTGFVLPTTSFADSITMTGCNFEQCTVNSFFIGGSCRGVAILGCRTEGCDGDDFQINPGAGEAVEGLTITGTSFTTDAGASRPIVLGGAGGSVRGFSITGNQVEYAAFATAFVFLNGDGESGLVAGNYFAQNNTTATNVQRAGVIVFGNENSSGKCAEYWGTADWGVAQGAWTPVDGSGAGLAITGGGRFTKIGRAVFWQAFFTYPATVDATNAAIAGLPYAVGGLGGFTEGRTGANVQVSNYGAAIGILQGIASTTSFSFYNQSTANNLTNANLSGRYIYCSGMYTL
jgi:hypothetical protein